MQHAEEKYTQAKQLYDEIADELYKELPMLYDRLGVCVIWKIFFATLIHAMLRGPYKGVNIFWLCGIMMAHV